MRCFGERIKYAPPHPSKVSFGRSPSFSCHGAGGLYITTQRPIAPGDIHTQPIERLTGNGGRYG